MIPLQFFPVLEYLENLVGVKTPLRQGENICEIFAWRPLRKTSQASLPKIATFLLNF